MGTSNLGQSMPGQRLLSAPLAHSPTSDKPGYPFDHDNFVRPWIFGNWWSLNISSHPLQLIGLGVRLAATPNIEDAEGNGREEHFPVGGNMVHIYYHGSHLRICTDDGKLS
jgi:hypothetical protein